MKYVLRNNNPGSCCGKYLTRSNDDDGAWYRASSQRFTNAFGYNHDIDLARMFDSVEDAVLYVAQQTHKNAHEGLGVIARGFSILRVEEVRPRTQWQSLGSVE